MTDEEKTLNTKVALAIAGLQATEPTSELVWRVREALTQKGGMLTVEEILKIQEKVTEKYSPKRSSIIPAGAMPKMAKS
jgi:hypothetical protein